MNLHSKKETKPEDVSTRVKKTSQEIQQLKIELEELIKTGSHFSGRPQVSIEQPTTVKPIETKVEKSNTTPKVPTVERQNAQDHRVSPIKKTKNYDVNEAREFIKRQREKRAEQLKAQVKVVDNVLDIRKQKLRELQEKTRELVSKNVHLSRERSKSRDRQLPLRPDKSKVFKSVENLSKAKQNFFKSHEKLNSPSPQKAKSQECTKSSFVLKRPHTIAKKINKLENKNAKNMPEVSPTNKDEQPQVSNLVPVTDQPISLIKNLVIEESQNIESHLNKKPVRLEHSLEAGKDTKETQTSQNFLPPAVPYPYNFINTVKRKFQGAIASPTPVDVGVQISIKTREDRVKLREEIKELLASSAKSEVKSFESHKCPNLDLKVVEKLELVPRILFTDSESDTSKNIPEISSESLALENINNLKLTSNLSNGHSNLESYSSDFHKESNKSVHSNSSVSTVKTATKDSEVVIPSDVSISSGISGSADSENTVPRNHKLHNARFINIGPRGDGSSPRSLKSLLTDLTKDPSKSMTLQSPETSLIFSKKSSSLSKDLLNTVTLRNKEDGAKLNKEEVVNGSDSLEVLVTEAPNENSSITGGVSKKEDFNGGLLESFESLRLKEPSVSLVSNVKKKNARSSNNSTSIRDKKNEARSNNVMKNITLRSETANNANNNNEIHLKFEAEVRLLNDFNQSFEQLRFVEKEFEKLKSKNDGNLQVSVPKILQNVDTQTSFFTKSSPIISTDNSVPTINYSRGSDTEEFNKSVINNNTHVVNSSVGGSSSLLMDWNLSNFNDSSVTNLSINEEEESSVSISSFGNRPMKQYPGILSLNIFEQLIKDEDTRIQQLKTIIKIREQALLDRTKSELVWLEIQKKQLIETGKLEAASLVKKKQRGIIVKHEQERNEIKKLKELQKRASEKRKSTLRQQRRLIKTQLSTDDMLARVSVKRRRETRSSGPLRVVQSCSESVHSETSISLNNSGIEDILSISSKSIRISEIEANGVDVTIGAREENVRLFDARKVLLMREAALQKRRKTAEELLRWHRALLDEERKIGELETAAAAVVGQQNQLGCEQPSDALWRNITERETGKVAENKVALCKSTKEQKCQKSSSEHSSSGGGRSEVYSSGFEAESVHEILSRGGKSKISSISQLIENFSKIEDEISFISKTSEDVVSLKEESSHLENSAQSVEEQPSIVEVADEKGKDVDKEATISEEIEESQSEKLSEKVEDKTEEIVKEETITEGLVDSKISSVPTVEDQEEDIREEATTSEKTVSNKDIGIESHSRDTEVESATEKYSKETHSEQSDLPEQTSIESEETRSKTQLSENEIKCLSLEEALESASKIEESLSKLNEKLVSDEDSKDTSEDIQSVSSTSAESEERTPRKKIDVKKRVSEILADASLNRGDKSPRLQDLYVTAYDVGAANLSKHNETFEGRQLPTDIFGSEAEELWKKQLAIEQEIKQIELQQKEQEQLPYVYMREIPNKPPPPYTPPSQLSLSIIPSDVKEISEVASYSSKVLYKAHQNNILEKVKFSENGFKLFSKIEVSKSRAEYLFNVCRDLARNHYKQFEKVEGPCWLEVPERPHQMKSKAAEAVELEKILSRKLKELFGFEKVEVAERAIIKWGRKKRDHVDEVLVMEAQEEEAEWTNFEQDKLIVMDKMVNKIMKQLIQDTSNAFSQALAKRNAVLLGDRSE